LRRISDLARLAPRWKAGFGYEFLERADGFRGLASVYGLRFAAPPTAMDLGLTYRALAEGKVDVIAGNSTDGQIQALDRTAPLLPLRPGIPARQTHDYTRHGTTTLFAALSLLDGKVIGECLPRHRSREFIGFLARLDRESPPELALHLIVDNSSTHKSPLVKRWLKRHLRFELHFIPTGSSWLNMVERWFRDITQRRIRRGTFRSVKELTAAIHDYLRAYNQAPTRFVWTKDADMILDKIRRCKEALGTAH